MTRRAGAAPDETRRRRVRAAPAAPPLDLFAVTAPGLEPLAAEELRALGLEPRVELGGVAFAGTVEDAARANLWLRTASRVVARVGEFHARLFGELERRARQQPWERFLAPGRGVRLRVTAKKSRLYHTEAIAERIAGAIDARLGGAGAVSLAADDDADSGEAPLVIARFFRDVCTLSADTSGALLHQRGYRLATAKAPVRETLAAAVLLASGWRPDAPLVDPMCGAGTIVIEGALLARRVAPGLVRLANGGHFAFEQWAELDPRRWRSLLDATREAALPAAPAPIAGSDRDAGAVEAAAANAERAGVAADIELRVAPLSAIEPPPAPGWLVTNPPYGVRVGERDRLRNLYAQLGKVARAKLPGWTLALLSADPDLDRHVGIPLRPVLRTKNGGIPVRVVVGEVKSDP